MSFISLFKSAEGADAKRAVVKSHIESEELLNALSDQSSCEPGGIVSEMMVAKCPFPDSFLEVLNNDVELGIAFASLLAKTGYSPSPKMVSLFCKLNHDDTPTILKEVLESFESVKLTTQDVVSALNLTGGHVPVLIAFKRDKSLQNEQIFNMIKKTYAPDVDLYQLVYGKSDKGASSVEFKPTMVDLIEKHISKEARNLFVSDAVSFFRSDYSSDYYDVCTDVILNDDDLLIKAVSSPDFRDLFNRGELHAVSASLVSKIAENDRLLFKLINSIGTLHASDLLKSYNSSKLKYSKLLEHKDFVGLKIDFSQFSTAEVKDTLHLGALIVNKLNADDSVADSDDFTIESLLETEDFNLHNSRIVIYTSTRRRRRDQRTGMRAPNPTTSAITEAVFNKIAEIGYAASKPKIKDLRAFITKSGVGGFVVSAVNNLSKSDAVELVKDIIALDDDEEVSAVQSVAEKLIKEFKITKSDLKAKSTEEAHDKALSRKKSYFNEVLDSIKQSDIDSFRKYTSGKYTIEQFCSDTHQSSKEIVTRGLTLSDALAKHLEVDEFATLIRKARRMHVSSSNFDCSKIPWKLKKEHLSSVVSKIPYNVLINLTGDYDVLIESAMPGGPAEWYSGSIIDNIVDKDPDFLNTFVESSLFKKLIKSNGARTSLFLSLLKNPKLIAKFYTKDEFLETFSSPVNDITIAIGSNEYLLLKDKNGAYLVDDETVKKEFLKRIESARSSAWDSTAENIQLFRERIKDYYDEVAEAYASKNASDIKKYININKRSPHLMELFKMHKAAVNSGDELRSIFDNNMNKFGGDIYKILKSMSPDTFMSSVELYLDGRELSIEVDEIRLVNQDLLAKVSKLTRLKIILNRYGSNISLIHFLELCKSGDLKGLDKYRVVGKLGVDTYSWVDKDSLVISQEEAEIIASLIKDNKDIELASLTDSRYINEKTVNNLRLLSNAGINWPLEYDGDTSLTKGFRDPANLRFAYESGLLRLDSKNLEALVITFGNNERAVDLLIEIAKPILESGFVGVRVTKEIPQSQVDQLKDAGLVFLADDVMDVKLIFDKLMDEGDEFADINVSEFSSTQKSEIIKFIENKIDKRFKTIDLRSKDLSKMKSISKFDVMKWEWSSSGDDLYNKLRLSDKTKANKKVLASLNDYLLLSHGMLGKATSFIDVLTAIHGESSVVEGDVIEWSGSHAISIRNDLKAINRDALSRFKRVVVDENVNEIMSFLPLKSKETTRDFILESFNEGSERYLMDIVEMFVSTTTAIRNMENMSDEVEAAADVDKNDTEIQETDSIDVIRVKAFRSKLASAIEKRDSLKSIKKAKLFHDALVSLGNIIDAKNEQMLFLANRFKGIKSRKDYSEIGYSLYFPNSRADLTDLQSKHGWCVGGSKSYGDSVISNGAVLVCACPKDEEPSKDNCLVLMYFTKGADGRLQLREIKTPRPQSTPPKGKFREDEIVELLNQFEKDKEESKKKAA